MSTHIRKYKNGWEIYYKDEEKKKHHIASAETKDELLHELARIIKRYDYEFIYSHRS